MQRGTTFEDPSIGNFIFIITPTQAYFNRATKNKRTLTLQKGMQTLGTLQQCIPLIKKDSKKEHKHKFHPQEHSISFRVINDKNLNYQWTVYQVLDGGEIEEIDCMQFSIQSFWKSFIGEYQKDVANLNMKAKDQKDSTKMLEIWKEIVSDSKERTDNMIVTFSKSGFGLDFKIEARSILDKQLQEYETEKVMRKLREAEKSQIRKSATTLSNIGQDDFTHDEMKIIEKIRRGKKTEEGDKLNLPNMLSLNINFLLQIKQRNESMKKIDWHNKTVIYEKSAPKARFSEVIQPSLEISSDLKPSVKKSNQFERRDSLKEVERQENLQLSQKIMHQKVKATLLEQGKKQDSAGQNIKVVVIYVILGILMLWLLINLMGHHSKVQYTK